MAKPSRKISLIQEQMEDNSLLTIWNKSWGLIVRPWFSADKLVFSFIEKGKNGAGFDIFIDCQKDGAQCFDNWAYDILHDRRLEYILANEKKQGQKYPAHYKYVTGESGNKSIGIANANNGGYIINGMVDKTYANVMVGYHDLRHLAERYELSYNARKMELEGIRREAEKQQALNRAAHSNHGEAATSTPTPADTTVQTNATAGKVVDITTEPKLVVQNNNNYFQGVDNSTGEMLNFCMTADVLNKVGEAGTKLLAEVNGGKNVHVKLTVVERDLKGHKYQFITAVTAVA